VEERRRLPSQLSFQKTLFKVLVYGWTIQPNVYMSSILNNETEGASTFGTGLIGNTEKVGWLRN
jgi:hypothetical protein